MKQIIYAGIESENLKLACEKMFRCIKEEDIKNIREFTQEVMTDAIVCSSEVFRKKRNIMKEISARDKVPVLVVIDNVDEIEELSTFMENTLLDFVMSDASADELNLRIEKISATRNVNVSLGIMNMIQHEVNRMAKLSVAGELIASVSHMINNPITAINLQLDLIKMDKSLSKELIAKIESIEGNVEKVISIVSTVRELKLGISDKNELVSINEETAKYVPLLHDYFMNHSINIIFKIDEKLPPVRIHHGLLKYIFLEIMLLLFHRCREKKSGKVDINIMSDRENVRFMFRTDFDCFLERIGMEEGEDNDQDKADSLTINALKADVNEANGALMIEDEKGGSLIKIILPAASI